MAKTPKNHGKPWTPQQDAQFIREVQQNTPTRVLGLHLGRTPDAIRAHAQELGISLKPTNQSPYGTKRKR